MTKHQKIRLYKKVICIAMYIIACTLITVYSHWLVCVGVFLWQWADNVSDQTYKEEKIEKVEDAIKDLDQCVNGNKSKFMQLLDEAMERSKNAK